MYYRHHSKKCLLILGDGMADEPIAELGGRTVLEAASTPNMDYIARHGRMGDASDYSVRI